MSLVGKLAKWARLAFPGEMPYPKLVSLQSRPDHDMLVGKMSPTSLFESRAFCPTCHHHRKQTLFSSDFLKPPISHFLDHFYEDAIPRHYLTDEKFSLQECLSCGLIYQQSILNDSGMKMLYEEWTTTNQASLASKVELTQELFSLIHYLGGYPEKLMLLDFGMGSGTWCGIAHGLGCKVYGHDLAEWSMTHKHPFAVLSYKEIQNHRFDLINTEQVFEHLPYPLETLNDLTRALKPGGLLKISVPNGRAIKRRLKIGNWTGRQGARDDLNPVSPMQHVNCFDNASLIRFAERAGLKQVRIPVSTWCRYSMRWTSLKWAVKNLIKPLKKRWLNRGTYLFFTKQPASDQPSRPPKAKTTSSPSPS